MEVKVLCQCGSKYKFDVEPVNERMPWPVSCPSCGADGTAQANEIIAQTFAANPLAPAPAAPPMAVPLAMAAPPPPPPPAAPAPAPVAAAPAPGGLRINKPAPAPAPPPAAPPIGGFPPPPPPGGPQRFIPATGRPVLPAQKSSSDSKWKAIGGGAFGLVIIGFIVFKMIWRLARLSHAISQVASGGGELAAELKEVAEMNLTADNGVVLWVKHDDFRQVAQECVAYLQEKQHRNFQIVSPDKQEGNGAEYQVYPAHNGYVRIMAGLEWKEPAFEATAQHLSEKYTTMVFDEKDVDKTGAFIFGVYDSGTNVFHVRTVDVNDGGEKTKTENVEWAKAHGYKPNSHDNEYFDLLDANRLTKQFGMKFWDEEGNVPTNYIVVSAVN
jgi:hypothetical protein